MIRVAGGKQAEGLQEQGRKRTRGGRADTGTRIATDKQISASLRLNASPLCASGAKACAVAAEALRARKRLSAPPLT
ncbi:MAG: hypothetical protein BRC48_06635 [Cyanobacteria bacterium QS_9_48_30]|nr:MAG: hypothetical protein BRC48_06635 [Cyanobacteria bacterium QS_9_48_30]